MRINYILIGGLVGLTNHATGSSFIGSTEPNLSPIQTHMDDGRAFRENAGSLREMADRALEFWEDLYRGDPENTLYKRMIEIVRGRPDMRWRCLISVINHIPEEVKAYAESISYAIAGMWRLSDIPFLNDLNDAMVHATNLEDWLPIISGISAVNPAIPTEPRITRELVSVFRRFRSDPHRPSFVFSVRAELADSYFAILEYARDFEEDYAGVRDALAKNPIYIPEIASKLSSMTPELWKYIARYLRKLSETRPDTAEEANARRLLHILIRSPQLTPSAAMARVDCEAQLANRLGHPMVKAAICKDISSSGPLVGETFYWVIPYISLTNEDWNQLAADLADAPTDADKIRVIERLEVIYT